MELEVGKTYLVNPDSWEEGWKEATYKFLGINNDSAQALDADFDADFDAHWFEHTQTGNVAAWYLYKDDARIDKLFLRCIDP